MRLYVEKYRVASYLSTCAMALLSIASAVRTLVVPNIFQLTAPIWSVHNAASWIHISTEKRHSLLSGAKLVNDKDVDWRQPSGFIESKACSSRGMTSTKAYEKVRAKYQFYQ